ncbi:hypothetical protein GGI12_003786 [Dipsacomyces acuminosporus]|nr:hypothetical protein GGI12_003786 [Dipsacomyces acuminosporus]
MASMVDDSWVVVDKSNHDSLYLSDDESMGPSAQPRVHIHNNSNNTAAKKTNEALAPELMEWISNAAAETSTTNLSLNGRNTSVSTTSSFRTNSSSAGNRQRRTPRRSSVHATADVSMGCHQGIFFEPNEHHNEGMFVVKVLEVKQVGATKPMNFQCVAQVGEERFVIPPVLSKPTNYNCWSAKMDDTFVFDVSRQFTFNLGVYGTYPHPPKARAKPSLSISRRHFIGTTSSNHNSLHSLLSTSSTRSSKSKLLINGLRKVFRGKNSLDSPANDPAYTGVPTSPLSSHRNSMATVAEDASMMTFDNDDVLMEEATDEMGRNIQVQKHSIPNSPSSEMFPPPPSNNLVNALYGDANMQQYPYQNYPANTAASRISAYLPRSRAQTTTSSHEINYSGPRLRAFSNASSISNSPRPLGELFLDFKVDRREKRRATFTLPVVNQEQVAMRGGSHVEMSVVLEYGIIVNETYEERMERLKEEQRKEEVDKAQRQRQQMEEQWRVIDEQDREIRLRGYLNIFTRSGKASTWKRYWAVLSCSRILFYETEQEEESGQHPIAKVSLFHLHDAGIPESDLVSIGPSGIELKLSPLAMTDRHRRQSAYPRKSEVHDAFTGISRLGVNPMAQSMMVFGSGSTDEANQRTLTSSTIDPAALQDEDDAMLYKYSEWQCRVYFLLDTLADRDLWLHELSNIIVPSAEFARYRARQRKQWKVEEFEQATETLRQCGKELQVFSGQSLTHMSAAHNAYAKKVFADSIGQSSGTRIVSMSAAGICGEFGGNTLTNAKFAPRIISLNNNNNNSGSQQQQQQPRKVSAGQRMPLPLSLCNGDSNSASFKLFKGFEMQPRATKRLRVRRSSSMGNLRKSLEGNSDTSSDDNGGSNNSSSALARRGSGASTVIQVVGKAKERRPGTVSRRFLFVWNINDL